MSFTILAQRCRQCHTPFVNLLFPSRQFHNAPVLLARQNKKTIPTLSKKQIAAKARKKALKSRKSIYDAEKMTLNDAISVLRAVEVASRDATYELVIKTEMKKGAVIPRGRCTLPREPKPMNKDVVLVFAEGRQADEARAAGADIVGGVELAEGVLNGRYQATLFLSAPNLIRPITPLLGRFLGPKGLMPSERRGTVTDDITGYIRRLKGTSEWKGDKHGIIRTPIAKFSYSASDVVKNVRYFLDVVKRATGNIRDPKADADDAGKGQKPSTAITKVILSSRQGPGIPISDL